MGIHDQIDAAIAANKPGHAQMRRADPSDIVSWHGQSFSETRLSDWDHHDARCALIDGWAQGKARVTPGTFSENQILHRAEQWQRGRGRHIAHGHRDADLAQQIRQLADHAATGDPCPSIASGHLPTRVKRSNWVLWISGQASAGAP